MSAETFIDTNVMLYAASGALRYPDKFARAWEIIGNADYAISSQVLAEFYVNSQKPKDGRIPLTDSETVTWMERLALVDVVPVDLEIVQQGVAYSKRYQISYWDAALIAAAEKHGCQTLYTEDLIHGQSYGSVKVINPFKVN
jgi:predicted nucleic acid-binding protein